MVEVVVVFPMPHAIPMKTAISIHAVSQAKLHIVIFLLQVGLVVLVLLLSHKKHGLNQ